MIITNGTNTIKPFKKHSVFFYKRLNDKKEASLY